MTQRLLNPTQVDHRLGLRYGRTVRLAEAGLIPHIELPNGEIRFNPEALAAWLETRSIGTNVLADSVGASRPAGPARSSERAE